jgi:hypothetical protein
MAIQVNINQTDGVVATYHVIANINIAPNNPVMAAGSTASFFLSSYLSSAAYQAGDAPITQMQVNVSGLLASTWPTPSGSFISQLIPILENYAINNVAGFSGGTIVS